MKNWTLAVLAIAILFALQPSPGFAQASDVDCNKCVDTTDIAPDAIKNARIANEAVNSEKIKNRSIRSEDIQKNAITSDLIAGGAVGQTDIKNDAIRDTHIADRVVGKEHIKNGAVGTNQLSDGAVTPDKMGGPRYFPYGPQVDVHPSRLNEWERCYSSLYNAPAALNFILDGCNKAKLILACRPHEPSPGFVDDGANYTLLAAGYRDVILTDTGTGNTTVEDNGVEWYYNDNWSWGFAGKGDIVRRTTPGNTCDDFGSTGRSDQRLCWKTNAGLMDGGFRCSTTTTLDNSTTWEREIFHAD